MTLEEAREKIIVAADVSSLRELGELVEELAPHVGRFKVGLQLISAVGAPQIIDWLTTHGLGLGANVFYDGKFKDIPNTVAEAVREVVELGYGMLNVHCLGGLEMMKAAKKTAIKATPDGAQPSIILGVTVLTSLSHDDLIQAGVFEDLSHLDPQTQTRLKQERMEKLVTTLASLAQRAGLDGVIASPKEIAVIRKECRPDFLIVTPGIRPTWAAKGDQKRVTTPAEAIRAGADMLVIGRPIRTPPEEIGGSVEAAKKIAKEIATAA